MPLKYQIDAAKNSGRDTICQNLRLLHRRLTAAGDADGILLVEKCFDFAKRMNAKLQENKAALGGTGPAIQDGHPEQDD